MCQPATATSPPGRLASSKKLATKSLSTKNLSGLLVTPAERQDSAARLAEIRHKVCEQGADMLSLFEAWDHDGDGLVSMAEFADALIAFGITENREDALAAFALFDADKSGELTLTELKVQIDLGRKALGIETSAIGSNGLASTLSIASKEMGTMSTCEKLGHTAIIVAVLLLPVVGIGIEFGLPIAPDAHEFPASEESGVHATTQLLMIPVVASLMSWICARYLDATMARDRTCVRKFFSMRTVIIWAVVIDLQCYSAALRATVTAEVDDTNVVHYYFRMSFALLFLSVSLMGIEIADRTILAIATADDETMRKCQLRRTQIAMMKGFVRFNKAAEDGTYGFAESESAADVLYRMWSLLRGVAKFCLIFILLAFYKSVAFSTEIDDRFINFEWAEVLFFLTLACTAVITWAGCEGAALRNVIHLTFARPFFLGDIIHVHTCQQPGGIGASIAGFVENITFSHVVIRAFDLKQVWVTHAEFETLSVSNWTRRPNKCMSQKITLRSTDSPAAVKSLLKFVKSWVDASADVKQSAYKKIALSNVDPGYEITIICFTAVGSSKKKMREKLLFDVMEAARRLELTLIPNEQPVFQPGQVGSAASPGAEAQASLTDLLPKAKKAGATKQGEVDGNAKKPGNVDVANVASASASTASVDETLGAQEISET